MLFKVVSDNCELSAGDNFEYAINLNLDYDGPPLRIQAPDVEVAKNMFLQIGSSYKFNVDNLEFITV